MLFTCDSLNKSGIVQYFNNKRTVDKEMKVTALSTRATNLPKYIVYDSYLYYHSLEKPSNESLWLIIEFKRGTMKINKYAIRSACNIVAFLINWDLYGSLDGNNWEMIDSQSNVDFLYKNDARGSFSCKEGVYKYIRIVGTSQNHIVLGQVEFFGTFTYDKGAFSSCQTKKYMSVVPNICIILLMS